MKTSLTKSLLVSLLSVLFLANCSSQKIDKKSEIVSQINKNIQSGNLSIINGTPVDAQDPLSKSVALLYDLEHGAICTVSILTDELVLTAAHCVASNQIAIIFTQDINNGKQVEESLVRYAVSGTIHPDWGNVAEDVNMDTGDAAVLRLNEKIPAGFVPAKLLSDMNLLTKGADITLAGFGVNTKKGANSDGSGTLRKTNVKFLQHYGKFETVLDQSFGSGACGGDSGGPAYVKVGNDYELWGITSRGSENCDQLVIYTNAIALKPWIDAAVDYLMNPKKPVDATEPVVTPTEPTEPAVN